jgi:hypothetical protein
VQNAAKPRKWIPSGERTIIPRAATAAWSTGLERSVWQLTDCLLKQQLTGFEYQIKDISHLKILAELTEISIHDDAEDGCILCAMPYAMPQQLHFPSVPAFSVAHSRS